MDTLFSKVARKRQEVKQFYVCGREEGVEGTTVI